MARLPIVDGDNGTWGGILNQFLDVSHNSDGTLIPSAVSTAGAITSINGKTGSSVTLAPGDVSAIPTSQLGQPSGVASLDSGGNVPATQLANVSANVNYRGNWSASTAYKVNDAVINNSGFYVCTTAHTSGASFSGTNWTELSAPNGTYVAAASNWFNIVDYGAVVDNATDDTTAWADAIGAALAVGGGTIWSSKAGTSLIAGASKTGTAAGYSYAGQLLFPTVTTDSARQEIKIFGRAPVSLPTWQNADSEPPNAAGLTLRSTATTGYIFDAIPTTTGAGNPMTNIGLTLEDVSVRCPNNPQCGAVNATVLATFRTAGTVSIDVNADGTAVTFPTGTNPGLITPAKGNGGQVHLDGDVQVMGYPIGIRHSEHTVFENVVVQKCAKGVQPSSAAAPYGHASVYKKLLVQECPIVISTAGVTNGGGPVRGFVDIEWVTGWTLTSVVDDPTGVLFGDLTFHVADGTNTGGFPVGSINRDSICLTWGEVVLGIDRPTPWTLFQELLTLLRFSALRTKPVTPGICLMVHGTLLGVKPCLMEALIPTLPAAISTVKVGILARSVGAAS